MRPDAMRAASFRLASFFLDEGLVMNESTRRETSAKPVAESIRDMLRSAVDRFGEREALRSLPGISKTVLYRAAAGLNLYPGTLMMLNAAIPTLRTRLGLAAPATSSSPTS
jgi:hypothetical protein